MNTDTERDVEEIRTKRWYPAHQTLGEGGWPTVYAFTRDWRTYRLVPPGGPRDEARTITAADDEAAWAAYDEIYTERGTVIETVTTTREVPPPGEEADTRPGRDESHAPGCAKHATGAAECTCGKADREAEEDEEDR